MDARKFKAAVGGLSDAQASEVIGAVSRARGHALQLMASARLPESAAFGAIARDLEHSLSILNGSAPGAADAASGETRNTDARSLRKAMFRCFKGRGQPVTRSA